MNKIIIATFFASTLFASSVFANECPNANLGQIKFNDTTHSWELSDTAANEWEMTGHENSPYKNIIFTESEWYPATSSFASERIVCQYGISYSPEDANAAQLGLELRRKATSPAPTSWSQETTGHYYCRADAQAVGVCVFPE